MTLLVDDYDRALAHYCGTLDFECLQDQWMDDGKRWLVVKPRGGSGAALLLARAEGDSQIAAIGKQAGDRVALFLQTDDFARDHAAMIQRGVNFLEGPRREVYGTVAVFRDLYGNRWDLIEHA